MRKYLFILLFLPFVVNGQIITTFAGGGGSSSADGIPATSAAIGGPALMTRDKVGNIYFATDNKLRKIATDGIITTVAGTGSKGFAGDNGPATDALLNQTCDLALDEAGNIYFTDAGNNRVRKINAVTNIITTIAGNGSSVYGGDGIPATNTGLYAPYSIVYNDGYLLVGDTYNHRIRKIDKFGIITTFAGNGSIGHTGDGGPATNATLEAETGMVMDASGNLLFNDAYQMIRKIDTKGIITTIAGNAVSYEYNGDERPATSANIIVNSLAINYSGEIFFGCATGNRVRKIDNNGYIHTIAGNGSTGFSGDGGDALSASIDRPTGIVFDSCDNLLIANIQGTSRIRKVAFNPLCWRLDVENKPTTPNISIYPNPANDELHIDNVQGKASYTIQNITGQMILQGTVSNVRNMINVENVVSDIYLLSITDEQGKRTVSKFVKQ